MDFLGQRDLAQVAAAVCPKCGSKTQGGKFCPECGTSIAAKRQCAHCGAEADGTPKFCPECGKPYGGWHERRDPPGAVGLRVPGR